MTVVEGGIEDNPVRIDVLSGLIVGFVGEIPDVVVGEGLNGPRGKSFDVEEGINTGCDEGGAAGPTDMEIDEELDEVLVGVL